MKLQNFTYRKPREKKPEPQAPGVYRATIYNVSEWTNNEGETALFVNVEIGSEYGFGIKFRLNADKDNTKEYAQYFFSSLLDACGIDGETFDGETDVLLGKTIMLTLEAGQYGLNAKKFEPVEAEPEPQGNNQYVDDGQVEDWDYNNPPSVFYSRLTPDRRSFAQPSFRAYIFLIVMCAQEFSPSEGVSL